MNVHVANALFTTFDLIAPQVPITLGSVGIDLTSAVKAIVKPSAQDGSTDPSMALVILINHGSVSVHRNGTAAVTLNNATEDTLAAYLPRNTPAVTAQLIGGATVSAVLDPIALAALE